MNCARCRVPFESGDLFVSAPLFAYDSEQPRASAMVDEAAVVHLNCPTARQPVLVDWPTDGAGHGSPDLHAVV